MEGDGSLDEFWSEKRVVVEKHKERKNQGKVSIRKTVGYEAYQNLEQFKYDRPENVQEIFCLQLQTSINI